MTKNANCSSSHKISYHPEMQLTREDALAICNAANNSELSLMLDISPAAVSRWANPIPSSAVIKVCKYIGVFGSADEAKRNNDNFIAALKRGRLKSSAE